MSTVALMEQPGCWVIPLDGCSVTRCCVDYGFTMVISNEIESFEVMIEQSFEVAVAGKKLQFNPQADPTMLGPAMTVLHKAVVDAVAYKDGQLLVNFAEGGELRVLASGDYEPWTLTGPAGLRLVSIPGGELAVWKPAPS